MLSPSHDDPNRREEIKRRNGELKSAKAGSMTTFGRVDPPKGVGAIIEHNAKQATKLV